MDAGDATLRRTLLRNTHQCSTSSGLVAPSPYTRLPPPADHRLAMPERPLLAMRRHSTIGVVSPRPYRSSPLAAPSSITPSLHGMLSAPPSPSGGRSRLTPLPEFAAAEENVDLYSKNHRRRSLATVLTKNTFPTNSADSEPPSPRDPMSKRRRRAKSTLPQSLIPPTESPSPSRSLKAVRLSRTASSPSDVQSTDIENQTRRPVSLSPARVSPSTSRDPKDNWLTQAGVTLGPPVFSRRNLGAVVMPVRADRRSVALPSTQQQQQYKRASRVESFESLPRMPSSHSRPLSMHSRMSVASSAGPSRTSVVSALASASASSTPSPSSTSSTSSSSPPSAKRRNLRSRTSSNASASSECGTPSLTMSPNTSASDFTLEAPPTDVDVDEMGVLHIKLNDVPLDVLDISPNAFRTDTAGTLDTAGHKGKGKVRDVGARPHIAHSTTELGFMPSVVDSASTVSSARSAQPHSHSRSVSQPWRTDPSSRARPATAPEPRQLEEAKRKKSSTIGRVWGRVVRSLTLSSRR